jgi:hypothetical protein
MNNQQYQQGYQAGRRYAAHKLGRARRQQREQQILDAIYLQMLKRAMVVEDWTLNGEPVRTGADRIELARMWTEKAWKKRPRA